MPDVQWFGLLGALLAVLAAGASSLHALLQKQEPAAAFGWIAISVLFPFVGPLLYFMLGVNRIETRARALRAERRFGELPEQTGTGGGESELLSAFRQQAGISEAVTGMALTRGNRIARLAYADEAYPVMLAAIEQAQESVYLATYIFESNRSGQAFAAALERAHRRGVDVRVLLDGAGEWYSWPRIRHRLRRGGVRVARFLPPRLVPPRLVLNLRNHRKLLVVDGAIGFTGGMNIGDRHYRQRPNGQPGAEDYQFRLEGPVVRQMEAAFLDDWEFSAGTEPRPQRGAPAHAGDALCRTLLDGPNEDLNRLVMVLVSAVAAAHYRVVIVTPYFLPPRELIAALQAAAIRGLEVEVILPGRNNLAFMHWATRNMLWELVKWNVRVYYLNGPFSHAKLFMVDDHYVQVGSSNMDPRSLRLNFELLVEVYDTQFGAYLRATIEELTARSRRVTMEELEARSLPARLRDAACWLLMPYL